MSTTQKNMIEQKMLALIGLQPETIGKTEARKKFFPLVDELSHSIKALAITDRQEPLAVMVGYNQWLAIITKLDTLLKPAKKVPQKINMVGSVKIIGDLDAGSKRIAERFKQAVDKSAKKLRQQLK